MNEFLNPKSMVTPGIAGAVMMFLVNGLAAPFPELPSRFIALALSFVLGGLVILKASRMKIPERVAYWVINSLVIFVVGFGANGLGREATGASTSATSAAPFVSLLSSAYAQDAKTAPPAKGDAKSGTSAAADAQRSEEEKKLKDQVEALRRENAKLKKANENAAKEQESGFFKKW